MSLLDVNYCKLWGNTNSSWDSNFYFKVYVCFFVQRFFWCSLLLVLVDLEANKKETASVAAGMQQFFTEKICEVYWMTEGKKI